MHRLKVWWGLDKDSHHSFLAGNKIKKKEMIVAFV